MKLRSGTTKRKKTSILDIEETAEIEKVMRLSRRFVLKGENIENLEKKLLLRNLRIVDVLGDSNCFFRALSHQLFGDAESHQIVRQAATDQVLRNPELYTESLINNDIQHFVLSLSKDREWADNHEIQAAADVFGVSIEIINSNSVSFAPVTVLPQGIPQNLVNKRIILGHIDQVHFVSTEFNSPFPTNSWGGYSKRLRKRLINTCPLDGPLIWLVNCAYFLEKFRDLLFQEIFMFAEIYNLYKQKKAVEARLLWFKTHDGDIPNFEKDEVDLFGSEAKQFFEIIQGTKVGKIERHFNCNNPKCNQNLKNRLVYIKKIQNLSETLQEGIRTQLSSEEYNCNACGGHVSEGTVNLPPLLIVPGVVGNDLPYNFEIFGKNEVVSYFLTLSLTQ